MNVSLSDRPEELTWHTLAYFKHSLHEPVLEQSRSVAGPKVEGRLRQTPDWRTPCEAIARAVAITA
jgi:hypothetical protein